LATAVALLVYGLAGWIANIPRETPLLLAGIAEARGAEKQAVRYYEIAVQRQPELVEARAELARLLLRQERWEAAGAVLAQLARDQPGRPTYAEAARAVFDRAAADALGRGDYIEAASLYRLAVQTAPPGRGRAQAQNNLAYVLADKLDRDLPEALRMAEAATQAAPAQGDFIDTLGWVHYRMGEFAAAERVQREAVRLQGEDPEVRYHLGAICQALGKREEAAAEFEAAIRFAGRRDDRDAKTAVRLAREGLRQSRGGAARQR
jgi:tetratricopeptide (TPR) repeat protein